MSRPFPHVLLSVLLLGGTPTLAPAAQAAQAHNDVIEEIVVIGTRGKGRTVVDSPVPVDVLPGDALRNIGTNDMNDILRTLIPSYNVQRYSLNDESSLVRPAELRGLPPDNTLVLINGKRLHRSGVLAGALRGAQGPDMSVLPSAAIGRVEVLRDGSSAQYGSDAIAGVINIELRDANEGISAEYKLGEFYSGDGRANSVALNAGLPLMDAGFANLTFEYGESDKTVRSEQRFDARALQALGEPGIPDPAQSYGQPTLHDDWRFSVNAALPVGKDAEIYGFGHYASRNAEIEFFWRNPNGQDGIYTRGPERLVFDLTSDGSGDCPAAGSANALPVPDFWFPTQQEYDDNQLAIAALAADPDCWVVNELYAGGYRPDFGADVVDWSAAAGFRGERDNGMRYDFSVIHGTSDVDYTVRNTLNASLGPSSPTSFRPGGGVQTETSLNVDLALPVAVDAFYSPLNVAVGLEWREESFETVAGDDASWMIGPLHLQGASIGSHGYPGYSPDQSGKWSRHNWAGYLDLEAELTEQLLLGAAVRYEDFEDFGSTTNVKAAMHYRFNDVVAVRASASTGFRAPTPGQSNLTSLSTVIFANELRQVGLIPPTNPVAKFYGGEALTAEESKSFSAGITLQPLEYVTITADYFRIDVEDRISIGPDFFLTPEDTQALIDQGVPGATDFAFIQFFGNETSVRTEGFDIVVSTTIGWNSAGSTDVTLAWNNTKVSPYDLEDPGRSSVVGSENQPRNRAILTFEHYWQDFRFLFRASYYDSWVVSDWDDGPFVPVCTNEHPNPPGTDECYDSVWVADVEAAYTFGDRYTIVLGADNVFDSYPQEHYDYPNFSFGERYPASSPIGYNGGFWYLRLRAEI